MVVKLKRDSCTITKRAHFTIVAIIHDLCLVWGNAMKSNDVNYVVKSPNVHLYFLILSDFSTVVYSKYHMLSW